MRQPEAGNRSPATYRLFHRASEPKAEAWEFEQCSALNQPGLGLGLEAPLDEKDSLEFLQGRYLTRMSIDTDEVLRGRRHVTAAAPPSRIDDLGVARARISIGLWDLDANLPDLGPLIERLNEAQGRFFFAEVLAAAPAGLAWTESAGDETHWDIDPQSGLEWAEVVRREMRLQYLVVFTLAPLGKSEGAPARMDQVSLMPTARILEAAEDAAFPYEAAAVSKALAVVLKARMPTRADASHEDGRCLLSRTTRDAAPAFPQFIEPGCLDELPVEDRPAIEAIIEAIAAFRTIPIGAAPAPDQDVAPDDEPRAYPVVIAPNWFSDNPFIYEPDLLAASAASDLLIPCFDEVRATSDDECETYHLSATPNPASRSDDQLDESSFYADPSGVRLDETTHDAEILPADPVDHGREADREPGENRSSSPDPRDDSMGIAGHAH